MRSLTSLFGFVLLTGFCLTAMPVVAEDRVVAAEKSELLGRDKVQLFTVSAGDSIQTDRGGLIKFVSFHEKAATVHRTFQDRWPTGGEIAIGNHEYLEIRSIDVAKQTATVRLRSKTTLYFWEAFSF